MFDKRLPALLTLCAALTLPGCFYSRRAADVEKQPVRDTGVGAAVIMPGQTAPVIGPGGTVSPGSTSSSSNGPNGESSSSGGAVQPSVGDITMIGGTKEDLDKHVRGKEEPLLLKWITAPLALLAAPFAAVNEVAKGDPEPGPPVPKQDNPRASAEAQQAPRDYNTQRLEQMEDELDRQIAERKQSAPQAGSVVAPSATRSEPATSIADELAALQRKPSAPEARRETPPAPVETRARPTAPREAGSGDTVADGIVDRNDDGRIDLWIYRQDGEIVRKVLDQDFDGHPDTTLLYDPESHQLARVEEDDDHDGVTDGWTDYKDGKVVRRRADANRDGLVDTWTYYRDGEISRHEQDTDGDGFRDRVGYYEKGHLVREEQDSNADGLPDVTSYYDAQERVTRREEDTNLDGRIDVINHYENGRLARKELLGDPSTGMP